VVDIGYSLQNKIPQKKKLVLATMFLFGKGKSPAEVGKMADREGKRGRKLSSFEEKPKNAGDGGRPRGEGWFLP
jgi:hypothetical protein